ncbi:MULTISPECIES: glycosyltransferase family 2 protein [unclassified Legionella]|uniref:glycosyltransferase family 2 protein n=1 Tax=unclassified Legionella TaxID=2622702 RepID=UPI0010541DC7|nr:MULTISPECIES: glycosyltransferase family 2 protein [unclassified Legionella]MDI9819350.1 glycosyltransferase family 2 protein [Legionella sp. PL877]
MEELLYYINFAILIYFIGSAIIYTTLLIGSFPTILRFFNISHYLVASEVMEAETQLAVTLITPMYNERELALNTILSALKSTYKNLYLIVVNDGSTDDSLEFLQEKFKLEEVPVVVNPIIKTKSVKRSFISSIYPNLMVLDKENGGAGDAINAGLNACFTPYFFTLDSDSVIDPNAISLVMYEVFTHINPIAIGCGIYVLNGCDVEDGIVKQSLVPYRYTSGIQANEYLLSHLFNRTGWNSFGGSMSYSGTGTLFNRQVVLDVGGFDAGNYAQDSEIIMRLQKIMREQPKKYTISFTPAAAVWTDVPKNLKEFAQQRDKWTRGLLRSVWLNRKLLFNPKYKIQGLFGFPAYILLEIIAPYVEFTAYFTVSLAYYLGFLDTVSAILYIILAWGFASYLSVANTFISIVTFNRYQRLSNVLWMLLLATLEMFGFRQYRVLISVYGTFHYFFNRLKGKLL